MILLSLEHLLLLSNVILAYFYYPIASISNFKFIQIYTVTTVMINYVIRRIGVSETVIITNSTTSSQKKVLAMALTLLLLLSLVSKYIVSWTRP